MHDGVAPNAGFSYLHSMVNSTNPPDIRVLDPADVPQIRSIVRRAFSPFVRMSFHLTPNTLVAVDDGRVCGAVVLKTVDSRKTGRTGIVSWIFVDPDYSGLGVASRLRDAALDALDGNSCTRVVANIDRDNTNSTNLFAAAGFRAMGPGALFSVFGSGALRIMRHTTHILDPGYALFVKDPADSGRVQTHLQTRPVLQLLATLVLHIPIVMLLLLRLLETPQWSPLLTYRLAAVVAGLLLLRLGAMWMAARYRGIAVRYHMWESGFLLSIGAAGLFGFLMPVTGSLYPKETFWSARELRGPLATMAVAGLAVVSAATLVSIWATNTFSDPHALAWLWWVRRAGAWFLLTDGLLPIYPFSAYNAARIYRWSRTAWVLVAGFSIAVAIMAMVW